MTLVEMRALRDAAPFIPFRIHLADGRSLDVLHPEYLTIFNKAPRIALEQDDGRYEMINLPIVVSVETLRGERSEPSRAGAA
jgi:hypothetical protein